MNFSSTYARRDTADNTSASPLEQLESHIVKWPFLVADLVLVVTAFIIAFANGGPLTSPEFACCIMGVGLGGVIAVIPFLIDSLTNSRLRMMRKMMEQREHWRINLEQELIANQDDNHRKIRLLKDAVASIQAQLGVSPINYDTPPDPQPEQTSLPLAQDSVKSNVQQEETKVDAHELPVIPIAQAPKADFDKVRNKLLSKAITQAQKNNPSKTVNRLIKGLESQQEHSA